ncbi:MAG: SDR family oxidoreductase [Fibrobacterota bacterium]
MKNVKTSISDLFSLNNKVALLTGASGHLGREMAHALCEAGAAVIITARKSAPLQALATELRSCGYAAEPMAGDITSDLFITKLLAKAKALHGKLNVIVNNAYSGRPGTVEGSTKSDFENAHQMNVWSPFLLVQKARLLLKKGALSGKSASSVINIASMYGVVSPDPLIYGNSGSNNPPYYGAAKAGMIQLTRYLACHLANDTIRVNSISPGPFPPQDTKKTKPAFHKALCKKNPMGRIGRAEELKGAVVYLASEASSYVTGANIAVDGGWTAW